ncbi:MAG: hypothetical protein HY000_10035 [Planctomycetes bacterium]|nr:hypothetical protein [Planctomycetota bacterium]
MSENRRSREDVLQGVRDCLVHALGVEPDQVREETLLAKDLGAASIDVLDVMFRLNKHFGLSIKFSEVQSQLLGGLTPEAFFNEDRTVSPRGYERIRELVPTFDPAQLDEPLTEERLFEFFRVSHLVDLIKQKLVQKAG